MNKAINKLAKVIASELKGIGRKSPVEQMAIYFAIGHKLSVMVEDEAKYGSNAVADVVACVPQLKTEAYAYRIMNLSRRDDEGRDFMLKETAVPMADGRPLTPTHWCWLFGHQPHGTPTEQDEWLGRELEWLRQESPSEAVLEHLEAVLAEKYQREMDQIRENAREAIGVLEMI